MYHYAALGWDTPAAQTHLYFHILLEDKSKALHGTTARLQCCEQPQSNCIEQAKRHSYLQELWFMVVQI